MARVAVVGAGYWGPNLIRNLQSIGDCRLVAVCDLDTNKLERMQATLHDSDCDFLTDYTAVLALPNLDAVVIATDIPTHALLIEQALKAGKHVFVEKPLAMTAADCERLGRLADESGRVLMVGHTFLYNPAVQYLQQLVYDGELGDVFYLYAQRLNLGRIQTKTSALWSLAVHDIAIMLYVLGELPCSVRAWGQAFLTPGIEDVVFIVLRFPSGRMAHIHVSWLDPEKKRQVTVVGSRKMVVYDDVSIDRKITIHDKGFDKILKDSPYPEYATFAEFQLLVRTGDAWSPNLVFGEPLNIECRHFIDCLSGQIPRPMTDWQNGYQVVHALETADQSLKQGGVELELAWPEWCNVSVTTHA